MKPFFLAVFVSALIPALANATISVGRTIRVESEVPAWTKSYGSEVEKMKANGSYPADGFTECRETEEIDGGVFLCLSNTQKGMNSSLGRASIFIEGLVDSKDKVIPQDDPTYQSLKHQIGGHDLRGEDLLRFHAAAERACKASRNDANICYNPYEKDIFENFIVPMARKHANFVVITFAHSSRMEWREVVTHEILHAQYFNQPEFRQVCDDFWNNEMSDEEKQVVRDRLSHVYDAQNEFLMMNEFQAYMLMEGAEYSQLGGLVEKYRPRLLKNLKKKGLKPVAVK